MRSRLSLTLAALASIALLPGAARPADAPGSSAAKKLRVVVVAGGHGYPVEPFRKVFAAFDDMECDFVDEKTGGEAFDDIGRWPYDAIVLYNFEKKLSQKQQENFLKLLDRGVGLLILHHAIYGYRSWPEFQKMVGVTSWLSGARDGVDFRVHVEDPKHPITQGLSDFAIKDETYLGHGLRPGMHVLLTTDEKTNSRAVAWVHKFRNAPVFYFQLGHDAKAYGQPEFATILGRGIRWTAGRLPAR